jgi:integrase
MPADLAPVQVAAGIVDADGKVRHTGIHACRHWFAIWCLNATTAGGLGLPIFTVSKRLGHSTISLTVDLYGHLAPDTDDGGALDRAADGPGLRVVK